jgi:hypothetical protein
VFASPRRLGLILYITQKRSVNSKTLKIWPELPIVIDAINVKSNKDVTNIIGALRHYNRVYKCDIYYSYGEIQDPLLNEFAATDEPFPALTTLHILSYARNVPVLPDSFLGRSAPRLRSLKLNGIPYPSVGKLLSSTTDLVRLSLWRIPHSGYIAPKTIIPCLSTLVRLEELELGFRYPRSQAQRASRHPPLLTPVVFPNLTYFHFHGDIEYLEDVLSQIETPILNNSDFSFFNQLVFDTPLLGHFIRRTEIFTKSHAACVQSRGDAIWIYLFGRDVMDKRDRQVLSLGISCKPLDWQLSALTQVLDSFLSSLATLESLDITVDEDDLQGEIEVIPWQELLHSFTAVKKVTLKSKVSVQLVTLALRDLAGERAIEVLPALQDLFICTGNWRWLQLWGPVKEAIDQVIAARQLCDHPVTIHY